MKPTAHCPDTNKPCVRGCDLGKACASYEAAVLEEIANRDLAEDAFGKAYYLVMGEASEFTNLYGFGEALTDMDLRLRRERAHRQ